MTAATQSARQTIAGDIIVGLMSGTSLDGVSAAVVRIVSADEANGASYGCEVLGALTQPYAPAERARLVRAVDPGSGLAPEEWCQLNFDVGVWLADAASAALAQARIDPASVRAIASHGQTVWHVGGRSTWQIGEAAVIAERIGRPVVSNFRVRDVAATGQGAPLVSMADLLLFASPSAPRALQNLGGIANVTIVPALPERHDLASALAKVRAFDTGPGVGVIDTVVRTLRPDLPFDIDGAIARSGSPITEVVDALLADSYFATAPPKSTGREHFSAAYAGNLMARCRSTRPTAADGDLVATAVALTARSIADAYSRFVAEPVADVVVSGGGTRNAALMEAVAAALAPRPVQRFSDLFFDDTAKEAVAFALLGYLHLHGQTGNVPSATGARGPRILGTLTPA